MTKLYQEKCRRTSGPKISGVGQISARISEYAMTTPIKQQQNLLILFNTSQFVT